LLPQSSYRVTDFVQAALRLEVSLLCATDRHNALAQDQPDRFIELPFEDPEAAARVVQGLNQDHAFDAVVAVDDRGLEVAAWVAHELGLPANSPQAVRTAYHKHLMRKRLQEAGLAGPWYRVLDITDDPASVAGALSYPCILKPTCLSASRGVVRVDTAKQFVVAFYRLRRLLADPELKAAHQAQDLRNALVEGFVPGPEIALEGLVIDGDLQVLCLFDKPDPMDGPTFEETIYVTPSRLPQEQQMRCIQATADAVSALGLRHGPIHAELRAVTSDPIVIEVASRSIGGKCSHCLHFANGQSLEELVLRCALGLPVDLTRTNGASGVMMLPIPARGRLEAVRGIDLAKNVPGIEDIQITAHRGQELVPLPEGSRYLGFIFARGENPDSVAQALRAAHAKLEVELRKEPGSS